MRNFENTGKINAPIHRLNFEKGAYPGEQFNGVNNALFAAPG
jgi:hypothetical protein